MKPSLKSTHRPLWRDDRTVQLGLGETALVVGNLSPSTARALGALDGSREETELRSDPAAGILLDLLATGGCVEQAPRPVAPRLAPERALLGLLHPGDGTPDAVLSARAQTRALVVGGGRVGAVVAHLLAASGIGRVTVTDPRPVRAADACPGGLSEHDAGLRRGAAATAVAVRTCPPVLDAGRPDVAVLCPDGPAPPAPADWRPLLAQRVPLLAASVVHGAGVVGPFTRPGGIGCPGCVSLHRTDRDPAWPLVERQLHDPARAPASTASAALAVATAAAAVGEVLCWLDGNTARGDARPATEGATLELALPGWRWRRRRWGPHPLCPCTTGARPRDGSG